MKRFIFPAIVLASFAIGACAPDPRARGGRDQHAARPTPTPQATQQPLTPEEEAERERLREERRKQRELEREQEAANQQPGGPDANKTPDKPGVKVGDLPYGKPVPGQPGMVYSPYAPDKQPIDVRGYAPGQEVGCPFTGKTFFVP